MKQKVLEVLTNKYYEYAYSAAYYEYIGNKESQLQALEALNAVAEIRNDLGYIENKDFTLIEKTEIQGRFIYTVMRMKENAD